MKNRTGYRTLVCLMIWAAFFTGTVYGFNDADLQKFKKTKNCPGCDLSKADISNMDISWTNLSNANLSGANLANSTLYESNLSGANLTGATLSGTTNLSGADLSNATWTDGKKCKQGSTGQCK